MLQKIKDLILGKPPLEMEHDFFGKILFWGDKEPQDDDYWECELKLEGNKEPISIQIIADANEPTAQQVTFCNNILANLDELFAKCWPIFEADFDSWTGKKFTGNWKDCFELIGFSIPKDADAKNAWDVCYFVDSANHYFTARFEKGIAILNEIDG